MIIIDRNKIKVNQFDTCILNLNVCGYKLQEGDKIEFIFNSIKEEKNYNDTDLVFPTGEKGSFNYSVTILQKGIIRTEIINSICEVI